MPAYTYTTIDNPLATGNTQALGINDLGQIVGSYDSHGFLYSGGTYTTLDDPLGTSTIASGINNLGQIVGYYFDASSIAHGFLYSGGTYTTLDDPLATSNTQALGINDLGQIVGSYDSHGFLYSGGTYTTTLDYPYGISTAAMDINDLGQIVGSALVGSLDDPSVEAYYSGFLYSDGTYTTVYDPYAYNTVASGINDLGQIVGSYDSHGFLYNPNDGTYTTLDDPVAATGTFAYGINDTGQIAGFYGDSSYNSHGFLLLNPTNDHAPVITTAPTQAVAENTTFVAALTSTDVDAVGINPATFSITGGTDAALFDIVEGNLVFKAAPDYETEPHSYQVEASAFDGTNTTTELITVDVTNVPGAIINGTNHNDIINATTTVAGQALPTDEEDTIYGGAGKDTIKALGGNDFINGGSGADTMFGGIGNDTYVVDNKGDVAIETGGDGSDLVQSSITFSLSGARAQGAIENLTLTGIANINGAGNALANDIIGNSGNNILNGLGGADILTGGQGSDKFVFTALAASTPSASDIITDFVTGSDIFDFSKIDANISKHGNQAFAFGGENANVVAHSVTWVESNGNTIVQADANGDTTADLQIVLLGTNLNLHVTDFIL